MEEQSLYLELGDLFLLQTLPPLLHVKVDLKIYNFDSLIFDGLFASVLTLMVFRLVKVSWGQVISLLLVLNFHHLLRRPRFPPPLLRPLHRCLPQSD